MRATLALSGSIEYNMRNIFLGKSYKKFEGEASPTPFRKNKRISGLVIWIAIKFAFIVRPSRGLPKYIKPNLPKPNHLLFPYKKFF